MEKSQEEICYLTDYLNNIYSHVDILPFLKEGDSYGVQFKTN
jgi:hypothetical protein